MLPLIVYFPDSSQWLSRAAPKSSRKEFVQKVQQMFDKLSGPIVLICGQNKVETNAKEKEKFVWPILLWLENLFFFTFYEHISTYNFDLFRRQWYFQTLVALRSWWGSLFFTILHDWKNFLSLAYFACISWQVLEMIIDLTLLFLQPLSLKRLTEGLKGSRRSDDNALYKLFTNVLLIHPPQVGFFLTALQYWIIRFTYLLILIVYLFQIFFCFYCYSHSFNSSPSEFQQ